MVVTVFLIPYFEVCMFQSISFEPVFPWWMVGVFVFATLILLMLRPGFGELSLGKQRTLMLLRLLAAILLVLAMVRPGWLTVESRKQRAVVPLLLDLSKSMQLANAVKGESRYQAAQNVIKEIEGMSAEFAKQDVELLLYGFDRDVFSIDWKNATSDKSLPSVAPKNDSPVMGEVAADAESDRIQQQALAQRLEALPAAPIGRESDLLGAIEDVTRLNRTRRIAGFVLLSDGVQNVIRPKVTANEVARSLEARDAPVHAMMFGPSTVSEEFIDAAIESMPDNMTGFAENEIEFRAAVRLRGFNNQTVPVQLVVKTPTGEEQIVMTQQVAANSNDQVSQVDFRYLPLEPGSYKLHVRVPNQQREVAFTNNQLSAYLQAFPGGLRVLYITGDLQFEHHFLVRSLQASKDIQVKTVWIDSVDRSRWPENFRDYFSDTTYDVFVLDNIDARALNSQNNPALEVLAQAVLDGKGLLMMGGYHSFGPGYYFNTALAEVLPIRMDASERQEFDAPLRADMHIQKPLKIVPTADHFITRLGAGEGGNQVWEKLPKLQGANQLSRLKDSAQVLLESENGDPLLVAGSYGGRVLSFAGDSTYLWIRNGYAEEHQQFWRQMMLWLAARDVAGDKSVWMKLSKRRLTSGENLNVSAGVRGGESESVEGITAQASLQLPDGKSVNVPMVIQADRRQFGARIDRDTLVAGGVYKMTITMLKDNQPLGSESQEFDVLDIDNETVIPIADASLMQQLIDSTAKAGGRLWTPQQVKTLVDILLKSTEDLEIKIPKLWRLGDTAIDAYGFVIAFFLVLMLEWTLRKLWGLV